MTKQNAMTTRLLTQHPSLRSSAQLLFFLLRDLFGDAEEFEYAGHRPTATVFGMSRKAMPRSLSELRGAGLLDFDGEPEKGTVIRWVVPQQAPPMSEAAMALVAVQAAKETATNPVHDPPAPEPQSKKSRKSEGEIAEPNEGKSKATGARKQVSLTNEQKAAMLSNTPEALDMMVKYLRFGSAGLNAESTDGLRPSSTDWKKFCEGDEPNIDRWTAPMFAGYYWYLVCWCKTTQCNPPLDIMLPQFSRLIGDCRNLMKTRTNHQVHQYIRDVISHWALICYLAGNIGRSFNLDSTTLSHNIVHQQVTTIQEHSKEWRDLQYAAMRAERQG